MREITPSLTPELEKHIGSATVDAAPAYPIGSYSALVQQIAYLSFLNKDNLLFFRGQNSDYKSKAGSSTFYPSIYRDDYVPQNELNYRFATLEEACRQLKSLFKSKDINGHLELRSKKYIQWSILQHYGVCRTPLLDFTHSLWVACSFAQLKAPHSKVYVYAFGLPYITNRITINSEHDITLVRLLSICPPSALRPYFQEAYLAGTADITSDFDKKTDLDFKKRLIAKFQIPSDSSFWGEDFYPIPESVLYPINDQIQELCAHVRNTVDEEILPGHLGEFIKLWTDLEQEIIVLGQAQDPEVHTLRSALSVLARKELLEMEALHTFNEIRNFRNQAVHEPKKVTQSQLSGYLDSIRLFRTRLQNMRL